MVYPSIRLIVIISREHINLSNRSMAELLMYPAIRGGGLPGGVSS